MHGPVSEQLHSGFFEFTIYWFVTATHLTGRPRLSHLCAVRENGFLKFRRSGRIR